MTWLISIWIWELIDFLFHALFQVHLRGVLGGWDEGFSLERIGQEGG